MISSHERWWLHLVAGTILFFLIAPAFVVVVLSFSDSSFLQFPPPALSLRWYESYINSPIWRSATFVSFKIAVITVVMVIPIALCGAYGLVFGLRRLTTVLWGLVLLPMIVPPVLLGISIYFLYAPLGLVNTTVGLVAAHVMYTIPLAMITIAAGMRNYDISQERVARSLGASRFWSFMTITLPQIRFSILAAAFLTFMTSFDEIMIAMFISGGPNSTLPKRIFNELRTTIDPTVAAISSLLILMAAISFLAVRRKR